MSLTNVNGIFNEVYSSLNPSLYRSRFTGWVVLLMPSKLNLKVEFPYNMSLSAKVVFNAGSKNSWEQLCFWKWTTVLWTLRRKYPNSAIKNQHLTIVKQVIYSPRIQSSLVIKHWVQLEPDQRRWRWWLNQSNTNKWALVYTTLPCAVAYQTLYLNLALMPFSYCCYDHVIGWLKTDMKTGDGDLLTKLSVVW